MLLQCSPLYNEALFINGTSKTKGAVTFIIDLRIFVCDFLAFQ